ncbi:MAG: hypothetical protein ACFCVE_00815 [Phycisphaerae bacterium]
MRQTIDRTFIGMLALLACLACMAGPAGVLAQAPAEPADDLLGEKQTVMSGGISFRPPAGLKLAEEVGDDKDATRFRDENTDRNWLLTVDVLQMPQPTQLLEQTAAGGRRVPGLLEQQEQLLSQSQPGEIVRNDVTNAGTAEVGLLFNHYSLGLGTRLSQRAYVRTSQDRFVVLHLVVPAPRKDFREDENVRQAARAFRQMIDSVQVLDLSAIRRDQEDRLFRTRALLLNWNERKYREVLPREQWLRHVRDGRDIGYTYMLGELTDGIASDGLGDPAARLGPDGKADGVLVGTRSRLFSADGDQVDDETLAWTSFDHARENFQYVRVLQADAGTSAMSQVGIGERGMRVIADPYGGTENNPRVRQVKVHALRVNFAGDGAAGGNELYRELPPFYVPQVALSLIPRLVPLNQPRTFMFAGYDPQRREVMSRYVDVLPVRTMAFGGQNQATVVVEERVGLEGPVTRHYMTPAGRWLGSVDTGRNLTTLPTDAATLQTIWQNADLSRPTPNAEAKD